jgi:hypothetical protein
MPRSRCGFPRSVSIIARLEDTSCSCS